MVIGEYVECFKKKRYTYNHHPVDIKYKWRLTEVYSHVFSGLLHPDGRKELYIALDFAEGVT